MMNNLTKLSQAVNERRSHLIHRLWIMDYTEDRVGKSTEEMTLTELEQIHINLQCQKTRGSQ
ncbi:hypothetical protein [Halobacillus salinus]|uniref:hypothetical protein n=1 Tax=Halobacillus salinus TaxID=192814 RepID=UPI0009A86463|nr:hypothetical protein [Halobacillus salinus]